MLTIRFVTIYHKMENHIRNYMRNYMNNKMEIFMRKKIKEADEAHKEAAIAACCLGAAASLTYSNEQALAYYELAAEHDPTNAAIKNGAMAAYILGATAGLTDAHQALAYYQRALQLDPDNAHAQKMVSIIT